MNSNAQILINGLIVLALKRQNGGREFLVKLAHTICSYELKGRAFLVRNKGKSAPDFMREKLLPLLATFAMPKEAEQHVLNVVAARLLEMRAPHQTLDAAVHWETVNLPKMLGKKLYENAKAMSS